MEKTIHTWAQKNLDKTGLLKTHQSSYCLNFSNSCFVQLIDFILRGMDKSIHIIMILVDQQKACDTLDQNDTSKIK